MRQSLINVINRAVDNGAEITWAPHYAEPGYTTSTDDSGVFFANWNPKSFDPLIPTIESRIGALIEADGGDIEWSDEWATCCDCGGAVRTQPDSYGWTPAYKLMGDCDIVCEECVRQDLDAYEEHLINDPNVADTFGIDWAERGWRRVDETFETGFHPGQNDDPHAVYDRLSATLVKARNVLFSIDAVGQFDARWSAWVRDWDYEAD